MKVDEGRSRKYVKVVTIEADDDFGVHIIEVIQEILLHLVYQESIVRSEQHLAPKLFFVETDLWKHNLDSERIHVLESTIFNFVSHKLRL